MVKQIVLGLDRFNTKATAAAGWVATAFLMVMTAVVTVHVICRYGFNYSFVWTEEVARYLMVWMTFLFFPLGHKRGLNVAVDFLVLPFIDTKPGILLRLILELLVLLLAVVCIQLSIGMIGRGMHTMTQALQVPVGWIYLVLPISFALTFLCSLEKVLALGSSLLGRPIDLPNNEPDREEPNDAASPAAKDKADAAASPAFERGKH